MPQVIYSQRAIQDLSRLRLFLASKSKEASNRAATAIIIGVKVLGLQPESGRPIEDLPLDFRDWVIDFGDSGYVVRYKITSENIVILAVKHQREVGF